MARVVSTPVGLAVARGAWGAWRALARFARLRPAGAVALVVLLLEALAVTLVRWTPLFGQGRGQNKRVSRGVLGRCLLRR